MNWISNPPDEHILRYGLSTYMQGSSCPLDNCSSQKGQKLALSTKTAAEWRKMMLNRGTPSSERAPVSRTEEEEEEEESDTDTTDEDEELPTARGAKRTHTGILLRRRTAPSQQPLLHLQPLPSVQSPVQPQAQARRRITPIPVPVPRESSSDMANFVSGSLDDAGRSSFVYIHA